jgi:hypothetical protein
MQDITSQNLRNVAAKIKSEAVMLQAYSYGDEKRGCVVGLLAREVGIEPWQGWENSFQDMKVTPLFKKFASDILKGAIAKNSGFPVAQYNNDMMALHKKDKVIKLLNVVADRMDAEKSVDIGVM